MKCQENKQLIYRYLDGELSTYQERSLYNHLGECLECQLGMESARKLHNLLEKSVEYVQPPQDFAQQIMSKLAEKETIKDTVTESISVGEAKHAKTPFFKKSWFAAVAGIIAIFLALNGFNQVAQITVDPNAHDGYFIAIQPRDIDKIINSKNTGAPSVVDEGGNDESQVNAAITHEPPVGSDNGADEDNSTAEDSSVADNGEEPAMVIAQKLYDNQEPFVIQEPIAILQNTTSSVTFTVLQNQVSSATWDTTGSLAWVMEKENDKYQLYESDISGKNKKPLGSFSSVGTWSPDKSRFFYTMIVDSTNTIWVESKDAKINLTPNDKNKGMHWAYNPVWSSNNEVAFLTDRFGGTEIMVADVEGNLRRVTTSGGNKASLAWSPDGTQIAYYSSWENNENTMGEIVVVSADGKNSRKVTPVTRTTNMVVSWSPDGKFLIVNVSGQDQGVWLTRTENTGWERQLTAKGGGNVIAWSPDGQKIAFSDSQGVFHVLIWVSMTSRIELLQVTPVGNKLTQTSIEWAKNSNSLLLVQTLTENTQKAWIAMLPKFTSAH